MPKQDVIATYLAAYDTEMDRIEAGKEAVKQIAIAQGLEVTDATTIDKYAPLIQAIFNNIPAYAVRATPGGNTAIKGDLECGYYGSFAAADMGSFDDGPAVGESVTATSLALATGVTEGTAFNETITFDKFTFRNEVIFISRKPIRYAVSWKELALNNCVFGGKVLSIGGVKYKMTLLRGSNAEITDGARFNEESEWGQLILPLLAGHADGWGTDLSAADLSFGKDNGAYNWCQETTSIDSGENRRLRIYGSGGSSAYDSDVDFTSAICGWRPALRFTL